MSQEFKRMQKLAGLTEATIIYGNPDYLKYYEDWKDKVNKNPELYKGLKEAMQSPQFSKGIKDLTDQFTNSYREEPDEDISEEEYVGRWVWEFYFLKIIAIWGKTFIKNLFDNGFTYNRNNESWTVPDKYSNQWRNENELTGYGLIWKVFPIMDTDTRERVGEYFEEFCQDNL